MHFSVSGTSAFSHKAITFGVMFVVLVAGRLSVAEGGVGARDDACA